MKPKVLVITPITHIKNAVDRLNNIFNVDYLPDPTKEQVMSIIQHYDAIFTNPNKSKIFIGKSLIEKAASLKTICTASTGTNHIDMQCAKKNQISILSLTNERKIINQISSTAEHAFALTIASIRNIVSANKDVIKGNWNYENFIGRQLNALTIGIVGYGRLGKMYSKYCLAFNSNVLVFDPYKKIKSGKITQVSSIEEIFGKSDIISFHVHVNDETKNMVNSTNLKLMREKVLLVNTSRGDIINEKDLIKFLEKNPKARVASDVVKDEIRNRENSELLRYSIKSKQVLITPHIGGMTIEAQEIAYNHAISLLINFFKLEKKNV